MSVEKPSGRSGSFAAAPPSNPSLPSPSGFRVESYKNGTRLESFPNDALAFQSDSQISRSISQRVALPSPDGSCILADTSIMTATVPRGVLCRVNVIPGRSNTNRMMRHISNRSSHSVIDCRRVVRPDSRTKYNTKAKPNAAMTTIK